MGDTLRAGMSGHTTQRVGAVRSRNPWTFSYLDISWALAATRTDTIDSGLAEGRVCPPV